jgi:hypothetical protein
VYVYWYDNSASAFNTAAGAPTVYELAGIENLDLGFVRDRINIKGLGSQTRQFKNVIRSEDTLSFDCILNETANYSWDLAKMIQDTTGTSPSQCGIVFHLDADRGGKTDRDAAGTDYYIYTHGAFLDELTIKSKVNDVSRLTVNFKCTIFGVSQTLADTSVNTWTVTSGGANPWIEDSWTKAATWQDGGGALNGMQDYEINIKNNGTLRTGFTNTYAAGYEKGNIDVTGNLTVDFQDDDEIVELTAEEDANTTTVVIATTESATITNMNYDQVGINFTSEGAPLLQKIPWTADSVVLA